MVSLLNLNHSPHYFPLNGGKEGQKGGSDMMSFLKICVLIFVICIAVYAIVGSMIASAYKPKPSKQQYQVPPLDNPNYPSYPTQPVQSVQPLQEISNTQVRSSHLTDGFDEYSSSSVTIMAPGQYSGVTFEEMNSERTRDDADIQEYANIDKEIAYMQEQEELHNAEQNFR